MVRCKSTAESTRVLIVDIMSKRHASAQERDGASVEDQFLTADESESGPEGPSRHATAAIWEREGDDEELLHMEVARVYENTLVQLGETLGEKVGEGVQISDD